MKVALLAPASSIHTRRWAAGLADRGLDVHLISAHAPTLPLDPRVRLHRLPHRAPAAYLLDGAALRRLLDRIGPDVLNAHYATGYGRLARVCGGRPLVLSVWGSDVYDFPRTSPLHRALLRRNLQAATVVASTSDCMARQVRRTFDPPHLCVTPFGIDPRLFSPAEPADRADEALVIGTVKALAPKYGVDTLIRAVAEAGRRLAGRPALRLLIAGDGPERGALEALARAEGLADRVSFVGAVAHEAVPELLRRMDVFVALSRLDSESFGVAAVEAAGCARPVVVSDAEGLQEVVRDGVTGLVVPRDDVPAAAAALCRLARDPALRRALGDAGRQHVLAHYTWERSLDRMLDAYRVAIDLEPRSPIRG